MNKFFILGVIILTVIVLGGGIYFYQNRDIIGDIASKTNGQTVIVSIRSQIAGVPDFQISYPAQLGEPVVSMASYVSALENVTFYKPSSPHNYPHIDSDYFLNIGFNVDTLKQGQTFESYAGQKTFQYKLTIDGRPAIAQAISNTDPFVTYLIDLGDNKIFGLLFDGLGSQHKGEVGVETIKSIAQSIKFKKQ